SILPETRNDAASNPSRFTPPIASTRLYRAADCWLGDSPDGKYDFGYGTRGTRSVGCVSLNREQSITWTADNDPGVTLTRQHAKYRTLWNRIGDKLPLTETYTATGDSDYAAALAWDISLAPGETRTVGLTTSFTGGVSTPPDLTDSDGDGLPNAWENGTAGPGQPNLAQYGADPNRKDIFIQVGPTKTASVVRMPNVAALRRVQEAFWAQGIKVHIDGGPTSLMDPQTGELWGAKSAMKAPVEFPSNYNVSYTTPGTFTGAYATAKNALLPADRKSSFHFLLYAGKYDNGDSGGVAWSPGTETLFAHDAFSQHGGGRPTELEEASTVMHELGHNLALNHGGRGANAAQNYKPNYASIMNYVYAFSGLYRDGVAGVLDFSEGSLPPLNESVLDEVEGLTNDAVSSRFQIKWLFPSGAEAGFSPAHQNVNWNGNLDASNNPIIDVGTYAQRLAKNEADGGTEALTTLLDHADWGALMFGGGGQLGPAATVAGGASAPALPEEETVEHLRALASEVQTIGVETPQTLDVAPGGSTPLTLTLHNESDAARTYDLAATGSEHVSVNLSASRVTVPAAGTQTVQAQVTLAGGADTSVVRVAEVFATSTATGDLQDRTRALITLSHGGEVPLGTVLPGITPETQTPGTPSPSPTTPSPTPNTSTPTPTPTPTPMPTLPREPQVPNTPKSPPTGRVAGNDRISTAVALSKLAFPGTADTVFVATGNTFPDALVSGAAAAKLDGPLLLVPSASGEVPAAVASELARLKPKSVRIIGGVGGVSAAAQTQLARLTGARVDRLSGADRYETAAATARLWDRADTVYLATGHDFPDALSAGSLAAATDMPVLLTEPSDLPDATRSALKALRPSKIVVLGGTGVVSPRVEALLRSAAGTASIERIGGRNRYETSALAIARIPASTSRTAVFATGANFPDALAGIPAAARWNAPVALTQPTCLPASVAKSLEKFQLTSRITLGGPTVLGSGAATSTCGAGS
ncbi:MAG: cell wall-binding repeat-containing protein, partial [Dermatophilus congolensis]|nr:cell wall-binding repeat-containing protein [Dermatophilus congolensis]